MRTERKGRRARPRTGIACISWLELLLVSQIHSSLTSISLLECLEILLHVIGRVFLREPALVHQLLQPVLDLADVLAVVLVELAEHFVGEPRLVSGLVAKTGAAVGNGVRKQRHIGPGRIAGRISPGPVIGPSTAGMSGSAAWAAASSAVSVTAKIRAPVRATQRRIAKHSPYLLVLKCL